MDLIEIEALTDNLLEALADEQSSERDLHIIATRLQGLAHASQVKSNAVLRGTLDNAISPKCGHRWSWSVEGSRGTHFEICTRHEGHSGLHRNDVTGVSEEAAPTKPIADRLHELVSYFREQGLSAYEDAADKLEALLMEGGI